MDTSMLVSLIALGVASGSIVLRYWESPPETSRRLAQLELDLAQSVETVSRWMKRENVRRARDEKESQEPTELAKAMPLTAQASTAKALLRERARNKGLLR